MWIDVLDGDEQHQVPLEKIGKITLEENYEVRLIIWETREVPIPNGTSANFMIRSSYQRDGLSEVPEVKDTDIHRGCKTGRAMFNWRMIYRIGMDEFPRLKLQIFDTGLGTEAVGELTLDLRTSIKLLQKSGTLEDNKIWVQFSNPQKGGASAGYCLIQLQILFQQEAENDPVGEARDEPNQNPVLKEPPEGRSLGDMLAGLGVGLPDIAIPDVFGMVKNIVIGLVLSIGIFFVMFLILSVK